MRLVPILVLPLALVLGSDPGARQACSGVPSFDVVGDGTAGVLGVPLLSVEGLPTPGRVLSVRVDAAAPGAFGGLAYSTAPGGSFLPQFAAVAHVGTPFFVEPFVTDAVGRATGLVAQTPVTPPLCGEIVRLQAFVLDAAATGNVAFTRGVASSFGPNEGEPVFENGSWPIAGTPAVQPGTADLNGDAHDDLLFLNTDGELLVHLREPSPGIDTPVYSTATYQLAGDPPIDEWLATGDWDGDGDVDLAVLVRPTPATNAVQVLLGAGDGTLVDAGLVPLAGAVLPLDLGAADLDGDGNEDLLVSLKPANEVRFLAGQGDGTFVPGGSTVASFPRWLEVGNFDGDGVPDLAAVGVNPASGVSESMLFLFSGVGDGTFSPLASFAYSSLAIGGLDLDVADLDGNGFDDAIVAVRDELRVLFNDGTPADETLNSIQLPHALYGLRAGDVDADGDADVVVVVGPAQTALPNAYWTLLNDGAGAFTQLGPFEVDVAVFLTEVTLGDWDADGAPDLTYLWDGLFHNVMGDGAGGFGLSRRVLPPTGWPVVADFDLDGRADLLNTRDTVGSELRLGRGDGTFEPPSSLPITSLSRPRVCDLDGNDLPDLTWTSTSDQVFVGLGDGQGSFAIAQVGAGTGSAPAVGDVDGDGVFDLVWAEVVNPALAVSFVRVAIGSGDGTFVPGPDHDTGLVSIDHYVQLGDLNDDGILDLVVGSLGFSADTAISLGQGDGTFGPPFVHPGPAGSATLLDVALADMDRDGVLDVVALSRSGSPSSNGPHQVDVLFGRSGGPFGPFERLVIPQFPDGLRVSSMVVGDVDHDGFPDVVTANQLTEDVFLFVNKGFNEPTIFAPGQQGLRYEGVRGPLGCALGDLNGDGALDLVVSSSPYWSDPKTALLMNQLVR